MVAALAEAEPCAQLAHRAVDMQGSSGTVRGRAWFGLSRLTTAVPAPAPFWARRGTLRALLQQGLTAGLAGAALAELPRTLGAATVQAIGTPPLTVSNNGRLPLPSGPHGRATWFMALAGANAGAPVLAVDGSGERLMLACAVPDCHASPCP